MTVDELLTGVNIALGNASLAACPPFDANGDGQVTLDELAAGVNNALNGCALVYLGQNDTAVPVSAAAGKGAFLSIGAATGHPDDTVTFTVTLSAYGVEVAATQNDIAFDPSTPVAARTSGTSGNCTITVTQVCSADADCPIMPQPFDHEACVGSPLHCAVTTGQSCTTSADCPQIHEPCVNENGPACNVDPTIGKGGFFTFLPHVCSNNATQTCSVDSDCSPGTCTGACTPGTDCTGIRAIILAVNNLNAIPEASTLYSCAVSIAGDAAPNTDHPLTISNESAADTNQALIAGVTGTNGTIHVAPLAQPTDTLTPTATLTITSTPSPTETAAPAITPTETLTTVPTDTATPSATPTPKPDCCQCPSSCSAPIDGSCGGCAPIVNASCEGGALCVANTPTPTPTNTPGPDDCCQCPGFCAAPAAGSCGGCVAVFGASCAGGSLCLYPTATRTAPPPSPTMTPTPTAGAGDCCQCAGFCAAPVSGTCGGCSVVFGASCTDGLLCSSPTPTLTPTPSATLTATGTGTSTPTSTQTVTPTPSPKPCVGDCGDDSTVTIDDILTVVNIALGNVPLDDCLLGDANRDGQITVDEILTAVTNALNGCPTVKEYGVD